MVFGRNGRRVARKARYIVQFYIYSEKYRPDLALTLSLYLYGGLLLILHIKYWSTYLYGVIYA